MTKSIRITVLAAAIAATLSFSLASRSAMAQDAASKPDNSAQNKGQDQTAQDQSNIQSDRETTAKVRKALIADKDLSMYAHNIKIITRNGTVTLKGPVKSDDEKQKVETDVAGVVSRDSLVDQLTVKQ
ncbi:MAG: BON domain-containing protein [Terracidiphilus sp.]|jgi:osmotically-inducible protein OsmY